MIKGYDIFSSVTSVETLLHAYYRASKGRKQKSSTLLFRINEQANILQLQSELQSGIYHPGTYRSFHIHEPKERVITAAQFRDRVVHHAIILASESYFERFQIYHSYACRKQKGSHKAILYALHNCRKYQYYLKMDIRKFFDSVDHTLLKDLLRRLFADRKLLQLFDRIIDSYEKGPNSGIPIGNLTSQYFANFYLGFMDHFIKEVLQVKPYVRYMDDFLLFSNNLSELNNWKRAIEDYVDKTLTLRCKEPIMNSTTNGISFLGFLIKPKGVFLLSKKKKIIKEKYMDLKGNFVMGKLGEPSYVQKVTTLFSYIEFARSRDFRRKLV